MEEEPPNLKSFFKENLEEEDFLVLSRPRSLLLLPVSRFTEGGEDGRKKPDLPKVNFDANAVAAEGVGLVITICSVALGTEWERDAWGLLGTPPGFPHSHPGSMPGLLYTSPLGSVVEA